MLSNLFLLATAGLSLTNAAPTKQKRAGGFTFFGVSESGAEFGQANIPGWSYLVSSANQRANKYQELLRRITLFRARQYHSSMTIAARRLTLYSTTIDTLIGDGMNTFRIPFLMERIIPTKMTGPCDTTYLASLTAVVNHITAKGAYAVLDPHNYGRYGGSVISSTSDFKTFW